MIPTWAARMLPAPIVRAARDAALGDHDASATEPDVVGDHHQIVDLAAAADHVSAPLPRSIVVLAPISTSSPMSTRPSCGTLSWPARRASPVAEREAEAVLADPRAGVDHDPGADQAMAQGRAGPDHAVGAEARRRRRSPHWRRSGSVGRARRRPRSPRRPRSGSPARAVRRGGHARPRAISAPGRMAGVGRRRRRGGSAAAIRA